MICQRCDSIGGDQAAFRVWTDIMEIQVCQRCADDARDLGLFTAPLAQESLERGAA